MTPKLSPCKGCPDRTVEPNCHTNCEKYLEQVKEYEVIREGRNQDSDFIEFKKEVNLKIKKRYNR